MLGFFEKSLSIRLDLLIRERSVGFSCPDESSCFFSREEVRVLVFKILHESSQMRVFFMVFSRRLRSQRNPVERVVFVTFDQDEMERKHGEARVMAKVVTAVMQREEFV